MFVEFNLEYVILFLLSSKYICIDINVNKYLLLRYTYLFWESGGYSFKFPFFLIQTLTRLWYSQFDRRFFFLTDPVENDLEMT